MEIIDGGDDPNADLVQVAFADTREEAELVRGLLSGVGVRSLARPASIDGPALGEGLLTRSTQRVYVRPDDAVRARELLGATMVEEPAEEIPEPANARYLTEAGAPVIGAGTGGHVRNYSVLGAYARGYLLAIVVVGVALAVFLVLR